jgi:AraC-like DNA-binding protein
MKTINRLYLIIILFGALTIGVLAFFQNVIYPNNSLTNNGTIATQTGISPANLSFYYTEGIIVAFVVLLLIILKAQEKQIRSITEHSEKRMKELESQTLRNELPQQAHEGQNVHHFNTFTFPANEYSKAENVDPRKLMFRNETLTRNNSTTTIHVMSKKETIETEKTDLEETDRQNPSTSRNKIPHCHPLVEKARLKILENIDNSEYNIYNLCNDMGMSRMQLYRKFKSLTDTTVNCFIRKVRLHKAAELIETGQYSIKEVTYDVGFSDLRYFRKCFYEEFGVTPSKYRENLMSVSTHSI